ncbi:MAG TPA: DNA polymerase Y family protein [Candidatus Cybelea sp.]|nr:DNA polymerase Y family protein [Candidatus Cybelea sp.]
MAFASIFVPHFMVQAFTRSEPALRRGALAIVDGNAPLCCVAAVNEAAEKAGIRPGMTKSQAQQFCPIEIRQRSHAQEKAAHAALLDVGWSVSPRIEDTAPDAIVVDIAGLGSLVGCAEQIAERLREHALRLGLFVQIATASKIDAAVVAARGFRDTTVMTEGEEAKWIGRLPVNALSPSADVLETLRRWGIDTCAALAALPLLELSERLGQEGVRLHELAQGQSERSIVLAQPAVHFEEEMELEDAVEELEPLSFLLGRLLGQLCARLLARGLAVGAIHMRFELAPSWERDFRPRSSPTPPPAALKIYERVLTLPVPMRDAKMLLKLVRLHLQSDAPAAPIVKILLAAEAARPRVAQGGLFLPSSPDPEKLELTVARLANLIGDSNIGSPELIDTHRPGEFHMRRFAGPHHAAEMKRRARETDGEKNRAPTTGFRVFRPPLPARMDLRDRCPLTIRFPGVQGRVIRASGPWRSSGDWWREDGWHNDEWDVEIELSSLVGPRETEPIPAPGLQAWPALDARAGTANAKSKLQITNRAAASHRGFYRIFYDSIRKEWFVRGSYD